MGGIGQNILREIKEDGDKIKQPKIKDLLDKVCKELNIPRRIKKRKR